jgi:hypothetical protein
MGRLRYGWVHILDQAFMLKKDGMAIEPLEGLLLINWMLEGKHVHQSNPLFLRARSSSVI